MGSVLGISLWLCLCPTVLFAQGSIVATGGRATGPGGSITYSVGQLADTTATGTSGSLGQGVQQPFEIYTVGVGQLNGVNFEAIVYPNPTLHGVTLRIDGTVPEGITWQLFDALGKLMDSRPLLTNETPISLTHLAMGNYTLRLMAKDAALATYRIIKNN